MSDAVTSGPKDAAWFDRVLRRVKYARYGDDEYDLLIGKCAKIGIDPWSDHVYVAHQPGNSGRNEMQVLVKLDGLRAMARSRSGYWDKLGPFWCGRDRKWMRPWTGKGFPFCARVGIRPKGENLAHWGLAKWEECAVFTTGPRGKKIVAEFWQKMPGHMLAKVAEAFALRSAFPDVLGGLYTDDEIAPSAPPPDPTGGMTLPMVTADTPSTNEMFHMRLIREHELVGEAERAKVIGAYRSRHPGLYETDAMRFRAVVLADLASMNAGGRQVVEMA
jgi:hypothetical protein